MNILVVTPKPPSSLQGNRVTAVRWAEILRGQGHRVRVVQEYTGQNCDVLIALHAGRSAASIERFHQSRPDSPLVVGLTGTDIYDEISRNPAARWSLDMATRLVVLQPLAISELPSQLRDKARVIFQSAERPKGRFVPREDVFEVCVMGHLRPVKDPFRTAKAARLLPASSRLKVLHLGAALSDDMERQARAEEAANPRYEWLGEVPRPKALRTLAASRLLVLSSELEGGANVISEALAIPVPVLASRIPGSIGILGPDYPGYFAAGDTRALAHLLELTESDRGFLRTLKECCARLAPLAAPAREAQAWKSLLRELRVRTKVH